MEENEREKGDAKEFARLVEQSEQAWKPIKKELQTINISTRQNERELKIEKLITTSKKENLILLLHECIDVFAWFTYICMV
jgi:transcription elongation GreA/GreB family factor